jgi:hypothetical protein
MRAYALLVAVLALLALAGCGGDDELAPQTPGEPASMPIPQAPEPPGGGSAEDEATTDETGTPEEEATAEPEATEEGAAVPPADDTGATTEAPPETAAAPPEDTGGGATAPSAEPDGPTNDTPPPAGSDAEQFEDFCAQNPGAC